MIVNGKEFTLSPTKVDTFYNCQRLFYYTYIKPPCPPPTNKYFVIGNIAHRALELFHAKQLDGFPWSKHMSESFRSAANSYKMQINLDSGLISRKDMYDVRDMLKRYIRHLKISGVPNVYALEKLAKVDINGVPVWLKADRVDMVTPDTFSVVDYKTSGNPPTERDILSSVQVQSYGLWLKQWKGSSIKVQGTYMYLRHLGTKKGTYTCHITDKLMSEAAKKYELVYKRINNSCAYTPNYGYKYCKYCDYRKYCLENIGV